MELLICNACSKPIGKNNKTGLCSKHSKEKWKKANSEREKANCANYYARNKEYAISVANQYYQRVKETEAYKSYRAHKEAQHRAAKLAATPVWADIGKIRAIYESCPDGYHVDHIVPLKGDNVCGLHVDWNLQVIPALDNIRKSNKLT